MDVHIHLPYSNHGIGDKDEENNERLDEGSDCFLTFLKPGQYLMNRERWGISEACKNPMGGTKKTVGRSAIQYITVYIKRQQVFAYL